MNMHQQTPKGGLGGKQVIIIGLHYADPFKSHFKHNKSAIF